MEFHRLLIADEKPLLDFYLGLSPSVTKTYRPFAVITGEVMREHLSATATGTHISFALKEEGQIVGHSFILNVALEHPVFGIGLSEAIHGQGWGKKLMGQVLAAACDRQASHITLTVLKYNSVALSLYKSYGFRIVSDHTFKQKDDSYFMTRDGDSS